MHLFGAIFGYKRHLLFVKLEKPLETNSTLNEGFNCPFYKIKQISEQMLVEKQINLSFKGGPCLNKITPTVDSY
jgi:hypothetical protein